MTLQKANLFLLKDKFVFGGVLIIKQELLINEKFIDPKNLWKVLFRFLHLFQCQSGSANLKSIGGPGNAGILLMNNNITGCNRISIINQSVTGIFEKEIDLLALWVGGS